MYDQYLFTGEPFRMAKKTFFLGTTRTYMFIKSRSSEKRKENIKMIFTSSCLKKKIYAFVFINLLFSISFCLLQCKYICFEQSRQWHAGSELVRYT